MAVLLWPDGSGELTRVDYSMSAWRAGARPGAPARVLGVWRTRMPVPGERPRPLFDDGALLDLFARALAAEEASLSDGLRYVLALLLIRRRLLRVLGVRRDQAGRRILLVQRVGESTSAEVVEVLEPALAPDDLARAVDRIGAWLSDPESVPGHALSATASPGDDVSAASAESER